MYSSPADLSKLLLRIAALMQDRAESTPGIICGRGCQKQSTLCASTAELALHAGLRQGWLLRS